MGPLSSGWGFSGWFLVLARCIYTLCSSARCGLAGLWGRNSDEFIGMQGHANVIIVDDMMVICLSLRYLVGAEQTGVSRIYDLGVLGCLTSEWVDGGDQFLYSV